MTENSLASPYALNVDQIQKFLPHRAPFLMVDRILEIQPTGDTSKLICDSEREGVRVVGIKNISFNEWYFQGHFPGFAIVPGVLIVESMAQVASFSTYPYLASQLSTVQKDFSCILVGVDGARFRRPVVPGDTLRIESVVTKCRGKLWGFHCTATVDGKPVAEADILANLVSNGASAPNS